VNAVVPGLTSGDFLQDDQSTQSTIPAERWQVLAADTRHCLLQRTNIMPSARLGDFSIEVRYGHAYSNTRQQNLRRQFPD
jgi:hypothetical protein